MNQEINDVVTFSKINPATGQRAEPLSGKVTGKSGGKLPCLYVAVGGTTFVVKPEELV